MEKGKKLSRYHRVEEQLAELFARTRDIQARMATTAALLRHKFGHFFWCGFYRLVGGDLLVGPYQGPLACQVLARGKGVCWAAVKEGRTVIVPDVRQFPGHIPCDPRSLSEIVVPVRGADGAVIAVLDVDSDRTGQFDEEDRLGLETIVALLAK